MNSLAYRFLAALMLPACTSSLPAAQPASLDEAKTQIFYSEAFQQFLSAKPAWPEITQKIETLTAEQHPELFKAAQSPFERLSEEQKHIYRTAQTNAAKSPTIAQLRETILQLQQTIETLLEELTPGYDKVRKALAAPPPS